VVVLAPKKEVRYLELVDDAFELVRGRWNLEKVLRGELGDMPEPEAPTPPEDAKLTLVEPEVFRPLIVAVGVLRSSSGRPSSHFRLDRVVPIELADILRVRRRIGGTFRSSLYVTTELIEFGASDWWKSADVKASRTGNGVRFRTWIDVICRRRLCNPSSKCPQSNEHSIDATYY